MGKAGQCMAGKWGQGTDGGGGFTVCVGGGDAEHHLVELVLGYLVFIHY